MARRKQDLAGKISTPSSSARPGWRDAITGGGQPEQPAVPVRRPSFTEPAPEPVPEPVNKMKRKTYLLYTGMIEEIETLAEKERVGINELVRYLLAASLDQVYEGQLVIPTEPGQRQIAQ